MTSKMRQFVRGMGSAIDMSGSFFRSPHRVGAGLNLHRTDAQALQNDWEKLSRDFLAAFQKTVGDGGHVEAE